MVEYEDWGSARIAQPEHQDLELYQHERAKMLELGLRSGNMATPQVMGLEEIPKSQAQINEEFFRFQAEMMSEIARAKMKLDVLIAFLMENRKSKAEDQPQMTPNDGILFTPASSSPRQMKTEYEALFAQDDRELEQPSLSLDLHLVKTIGDVQSIEENDCSVFGKMFVKTRVCNVFDEMSKPNPSDFQPERVYYDIDVKGNVVLNEINEVFTEMPKPIQKSFYMESLAPSKPENQLGDEEVQHPLMKMGCLKVVHNLFDELTTTFQEQVMNDQLTNPGGMNFNNITLFDPGGNRKYTMSSSGGFVFELFGKAYRPCDNAVVEIDGRENVMKSDACSDLCIWFDDLTDTSSTALFNDQVNEHYAHYFCDECPQPFLNVQSDRNGGGVDHGGVVLPIMDLLSVLNPMDETTMNGSCKGSTKANIGTSTAITESVWGKTVMNDHAHVILYRMTYPSPTFQHSFYLCSSFGMDETDGSYPINIDNKSFDYRLNDNMWLDELLMLIFDPGGCSRLYRGSDLLEYNGEHGCFHFTTNVDDAPEYIYYAFDEDLASHLSKLAVGIPSTGFARVTFDERLCEHKQAFIILMNSQQALLQDMDKCDVTDLVHLFPFPHPEDVITTSINIFISWKVAHEEVEGAFTGESFYSVQNRDKFNTSGSFIAVANSKIYVIPLDLAERVMLPLVFTVLVEFTLLGSYSLGYQHRVTYNNSQLLDGFKQCRARQCSDNEHLNVRLINKIGVSIVTSVVHFNEIFRATMYHLNVFHPCTKANMAKWTANGVHGNLQCIGAVFAGILAPSVWFRPFDPGGNRLCQMEGNFLKTDSLSFVLVIIQREVFLILVCDTGQCALIDYILVDKDVFKRVGKRILAVAMMTSIIYEQTNGKRGYNKACKPLQQQLFLLACFTNRKLFWLYLVMVRTGVEIANKRAMLNYDVKSLGFDCEGIIDPTRFKGVDNDSSLHVAGKHFIKKDMDQSTLFGPDVVNTMVVACVQASCWLVNRLGDSIVDSFFYGNTLFRKTLALSTIRPEHYIWDPGRGFHFEMAILVTMINASIMGGDMHSICTNGLRDNGYVQTTWVELGYIDLTVPHKEIFSSFKLVRFRAHSWDSRKALVFAVGIDMKNYIWDPGNYLFCYFTTLRTRRFKSDKYELIAVTDVMCDVISFKYIVFHTLGYPGLLKVLRGIYKLKL